MPDSSDNWFSWKSIWLEQNQIESHLKMKRFLHQTILILVVKINFNSGSVPFFPFYPFSFFFYLPFFPLLLKVDEYCKNVKKFIVKGSTRILVLLCSSSLWRSEQRRKIVKSFMSLTYAYSCHLIGPIHIFTRVKGRYYFFFSVPTLSY